MGTIDYIKNELKKLYKNNPYVHVSIKLMPSKVLVKDLPVKIVGIYRNIFQVEEIDNAVRPERHSFQYGDILIGHIALRELDYTPPEIPSQK